MILRLLSAAALLSFGLLLAQETAPRKPDLARELDLELADIEPWPAALSAGQTTHIEEKLGQPGLLAGVELFRGAGKIPGGSDAEPLFFLRLALREPLAGARLVCAVHADGRLAHAAVGGRPEFDQDTELVWQLFLGQLCSYGSLGPPGEFLLDPVRIRTLAETEAALATLRTRDPDGELRSALARQRVAMRGFTLLQRRLILLPEQPPPAAWLAQKRHEFEDLARHSGAFEGLLGSSGRAEHARRASEAATYLGELESLAATGSIGAFRSAQGRMRGLCRDCHAVRTEEGDSWEDAFGRLRGELELPSGLFRVGYDLAPALGDQEGQVSQLLADAIRALLLLTAGLDRR